VKTNRELVLETKEKFKNKNIPLSVINELLIKVNNFKNYTELVLFFDKPVLNLKEFNKYLNLILEGIPYQYVLKEASFVNFNLYVDKNVLIPRTE